METAVNEVPPTLKEIFCRVLEVPMDQITPELSTRTTRNWVSLKHVELVVEVEEKYGVAFAATEIFALTTVQGFCEVLARKQAGKHAAAALAGGGR